MSELIAFLEERLTEIERAFEGVWMPPGYEHAIPSMVLVLRQVLELQKNWPVLVRTPPKLEVGPMDDFDPTSLTMRMTERIAWTTHEEYLKRFGEEPLPMPVVKEMLQMFRYHPDFKPEWIE